MATIDTAHKAPLIVHTAAGVYIAPEGLVLTFAPEGIAAVEASVSVPDVGWCWYVAGVTPGSTTLTIVGGGSSTTLAIDVAAAPLVAELGPAVPR